MESYRLYYWPMLQGRGEFIRLVLAEADASHVDVARLPEEQGGGVQAIRRVLEKATDRPTAFAPPVLQAGDLWLWQTANICRWLAERHDLIGEDEQLRQTALGLQLTLADWVAEAHDTHHPLATGLYYEDQREAAIEKARHFTAERVPKYASFFATTLEQSGGDYLLGDFSYVDLALFQVIEGLGYAFPKNFRTRLAVHQSLMILRNRVAERPRIAAYLQSERRIPFNEHGIFRHYPELDAVDTD